MLLTPPDVFSQTLLAIPMWACRVGLFFARFYVKRRTKSSNKRKRAARSLPRSCIRSRRMVRPHRVDGFQMPDMHLVCPGTPDSA